MRVLLDTTYARRGPSGTGVYIDRLAQALREEGVEVVEAANERRPDPAGGGLGSVRNLALDARWTQVDLPRRAREAQAERHPSPAARARGQGAMPAGRHDPRPRVRAPARVLQPRLPPLRLADAPPRGSRRAGRRRRLRDDGPRRAGALGPRPRQGRRRAPRPRPGAQARRGCPGRALPLRRRRRAAQEPRAPARRARPLPRGVPDGCRAGRAGRRRRRPAARAGGPRTIRAGRRALRARARPREAPQRRRRARAPVAARGLRPHAARGDVRRRARHRRPLAGPHRDLRRRGAVRRSARRARPGHGSSPASPATPTCAPTSRRRGRARAADFSWQASARAHIAAYNLARTR